MAPMRREHGAIRRLIGSARDLRPRMAAGLPIHDEFALRRILYRLFVMMRVHLYEEERYLGIVDRNADDPERAAIVAGMRHAPVEAL
jgi:hypothetical protein